MPIFIGFSTIRANQPKTTNDSVGVDGGTGGILKSINIGKKYRMVDESLVIRDFMNALNIQQGQKVGQPQYGTTLWTFIFEPNTFDVQKQIEDEIKRVASQDPRIALNSVKSFPQENGILLEVEASITPFNNALQLSIFFDSATKIATV